MAGGIHAPEAKDAKSSETKPKGKKRSKSGDAEEDDEPYSPWVDILRVLSFLLLASCGLSYLISGGESWTWGFDNKPRYLRLGYWKNLVAGPLELTPDELALYDGSDPTKPIYLAINHSIYDVSSNPRVYGPGGSYSQFAGIDASRAYVTGCFRTDRTPDMRGAEEMYLPLDDAETDAHWTADELAALREREREAALERVHGALKHWVDFFANHEAYLYVGRVVRPDDWLETSVPPALCDRAVRNRKRRKLPGEEEEEKRLKEERRRERRERKEQEKREREEARQRGEL
ncbi:hypothetical protein ACRALDRAFT_2105582 [Sodiomyces alcalophilus JCM 7366]|uniref:uncharacterized protein n=1 Tax=Sodiomyces alcalophilus JCM 7366 TaxID=591952 RepID=UPI0039B593BB